MNRAEWSSPSWLSMPRAAGGVRTTRPRRLAPLLALVCVLASIAPRARAQSSTTAAEGSGQPVYSRYEQERIAHALARVAGVPDADPKGKRVESVEVVAFDVFEPDDPVPQFLNWFHVTTKNHVIEREVLLPIGSHYDQRLADETRRNLVNLELFSVVVVMPLRGTSPDSVRLLVLTKDLWSLRLNWNGRYNKGTIDYLSLQPTEQNLFGSGRQVFGILVFGPRTYTVGAGFYEPRLDDSHISISANVQAIVNCQRGEVEGSTGSFQYALPLYSTSTPWSYGTSVSWSHGRALFPLIGNQGDGTICSQPSTQTSLVSISGTGKTAEYPDYYLFDSESFSQGFTRSFGRIYKTNLSFGIEATRAAYTAVDLTDIHEVSPLREPSAAELDGVSQIYPGTWFSGRHVPENAKPPADFSAAFYRGLSALTDAERARVVAFYERQLPIGNRRISPFFQIQSFTTNFERDLNVETLALTEDYRLGHIATLRIYPALRDIGSSRNLLGVQASASYAFAVGTGYLKAGASNAIELSRPDQTDASLALSLRFNSPRLLLGRFIYDVEFTDHYRNYRNTSFTLGGTSRLRGYENTADFGQNLFVSNLEFRTRPLEIFTVQLAGVLFHDMGDAFNSFDKIHLLQGAGLGLRFLAPQLDRDVFRVDLGFPIPANAPHGEISVIATFGQAFPSP